MTADARMDASRASVLLAVLAVVWWLFITAMAWLGAVVRHVQEAPDQDESGMRRSDLEHYDPSLGVTILRPLKGVDCNLFSNLESSFLQTHTKIEILLAVDSKEDAAVEIAEKLLAKYKHVDAKLVIGERIIGHNPKINNVIESYEQAKYDIIWMCDSNIVLKRNCLKRSLAELNKPNVGLVHHLPIAVHPQSFASALEQVYMNGNHAKMYLGINAVGPSSCVVGKSNLYRRSDLEQCGGLKFFGRYLAEDNTIGQALWDMSRKHSMTCDGAFQSLDAMTIHDYLQRKIRWARIRKYCVPLGAAIEPFAESIVCGAIASYGFSKFLNLPQIPIILTHILGAFLVDYIVLKNLLPHQKTISFPYFVLLWIIREISALPIFLYAVSGSTVTWRNNTYRLIRGGELQKVKNGIATPLNVSHSSSLSNIVAATAADDDHHHHHYETPLFTSPLSKLSSLYTKLFSLTVICFTFVTHLMQRAVPSTARITWPIFPVVPSVSETINVSSVSHQASKSSNHHSLQHKESVSTRRYSRKPRDAVI